MRENLGEVGDVEAITKLVRVEGLDLIDVGCGSGNATRMLAELGATVLGVEPDSVQAEKNRTAEPVPGLTFAEAGAEALPVEDDSADGVLFFRSLHHVHRELMDDAIREAIRVLRPDGFLVVFEPGMDCSHFEMMRPFNDETAVRTLAQETLDTMAEPVFREVRKLVFVQHPRWESFDAMADFFSGLSFHAITRDQIDLPEVRAAFEKARTDDGYVFDQTTLVNFYRSPNA